MLTIESRMVSRFWARSAISLKHISFWCPFLDLHLSMYHSNVGVQIIAMLVQHNYLSTEFYNFHSHSYLETSEIQVHVGIWKSAIAIVQLISYTSMHAMSIVCVSFARVHHPDSWFNEVLPWNRFHSSLFLGELEPPSRAPDWETNQPKNSRNSCTDLNLWR